MKKQKFYPKQVIRKLKGRSANTLSVGEKCALEFFFRKGRKYGITLGIFSNVKTEDLMSSFTREQSDVVLANANSKIFLKAG